MSLYRHFGKRLLDLAITVPVAAVATPVVLGAAIGIKATMGGPVVFRQQRPGKDGRPFMLYKLRTMRDAVDVNGAPLPDSQRLTAFGNALRRSSVDELPQLINVLKGDMSLVGPRPLLMQYLERYTPTEARRHEVRPGITGHAQVNGRNALSWAQKFEHDVWYVDHLSLGVDLRILVATAQKVLARLDISAGQHATMPEFQGSSSPSPASKREG